MIREILTLVVDGVATQYYIQFDKTRTRFAFQPTLKHKTAPSFEMLVDGDGVKPDQEIDEALDRQAKEKITTILEDRLFDKF